MIVTCYEMSLDRYFRFAPGATSDFKASMSSVPGKEAASLTEAHPHP